MRFPIEQDVNFFVLDAESRLHAGTGRTVNIGSKGLLISTDQPPPSGAPIEVAVSWPAKLDDEHRIKLVVRGKVVRSEPRTIAVAIKNHEFRTAGSARGRLLGPSARYHSGGADSPVFGSARGTSRA